MLSASWRCSLMNLGMWYLGTRNWCVFVCRLAFLTIPMRSVHPRRVYEQVGACGAGLILPWCVVGHIWVVAVYNEVSAASPCPSQSEASPFFSDTQTACLPSITRV